MVLLLLKINHSNLTSYLKVLKVEQKTMRTGMEVMEMELGIRKGKVF